MTLTHSITSRCGSCGSCRIDSTTERALPEIPETREQSGGLPLTQENLRILQAAFRAIRSIETYLNREQEDQDSSQLIALLNRLDNRTEGFKPEQLTQFYAQLAEISTDPKTSKRPRAVIAIVDLFFRYVQHTPQEAFATHKDRLTGEYLWSLAPKADRGIPLTDMEQRELGSNLAILSQSQGKWRQTAIFWGHVLLRSPEVLQNYPWIYNTIQEILPPADAREIT